MEDFRAALYRSYVSTHVAHRREAQDVEALRRRARIYQQHFGRFLPRNPLAKIADLGCGSGSLVWWLAKRGYRNVCGVDASAEQVALARASKIDNVIEADIFTFLASNAGFDLLFARDVIEHFDKQNLFEFLMRSRSALSKGGVLVVQAPNAESPFFGRVRYGDFTHELAFTSSSLQQVLSATGFAHVEVHPWRPAVTGARSALRYLAWRAIEPMLKLPILIESGGRRIVTMNLIAAARRSD